MNFINTNTIYQSIVSNNNHPIVEADLVKTPIQIFSGVWIE